MCNPVNCLKQFLVSPNCHDAGILNIWQWSSKVGDLLKQKHIVVSGALRVTMMLFFCAIALKMEAAFSYETFYLLILVCRVT
jgi:hypothetical protein